MKVLRQLWDFVFGALTIGAAGLVTFVVTSQLARFTARSQVQEETTAQTLGLLLVMVLSVAAPITAVWFAARWRSRHRILPANFLAGEILVGLAGGAALLFYLAALALFGDPNW